MKNVLQLVFDLSLLDLRTSFICSTTSICPSVISAIFRWLRENLCSLYLQTFKLYINLHNLRLETKTPMSSCTELCHPYSACIPTPLYSQCSQHTLWIYGINLPQSSFTGTSLVFIHCNFVGKIVLPGIRIWYCRITVMNKGKKRPLRSCHITLNLSLGWALDYLYTFYSLLYIQISWYIQTTLMLYSQNNTIIFQPAHFCTLFPFALHHTVLCCASWGVHGKFLK